MGAIYALFAAAPTEVGAALEDGPYAGEGFPVIDAVDHALLAPLARLLLGGRTAAWVGELIEPVIVAGEEGPWITGVPGRLTAALAGLSDERAVEVADRWAADVEAAAAAPPPDIPDQSLRQSVGVVGVLLVGLLFAVGFVEHLFRWIRHPLSGWPREPDDEPDLSEAEPWSPGVLDRLRELAAGAEASGRNLYIWQSP